MVQKYTKQGLGWLAVFILVLSTIITLGAGQQAEAQEPIVNVGVNVRLSVGGESYVEQGQISYDIIWTNPQTNQGEVVYSYRSDNPTSEALVLNPGTYKFRLYDGGNFQRDGKAIQATQVQMTDPSDATKTMDATDLGTLNTWEDGRVVLDIPFTVEAADALLNSEIGQYETDLTISLSDGDATNSVSPEEPTESADQEGGKLQLSVKGEDGVVVEGATVQIQEQAYQTDVNGEVIVDELTPGELAVSVSELPEGYALGENASQVVTIQQGSMTTATLTVLRLEEPTTGVVELTFLDSATAEAVAGVTAQLGGQVVTSDEQGMSRFDQVDIGEATYTVTQLPEGYSLEQMEGSVMVDSASPMTVAIQLTKSSKGSVVFTVLDETDQAVAGVDIAIQEQVLTTNDAGQVELEAVSEGGYSYQVTAVPEGYQAPAEGSVNVSADSQIEEVIHLSKLVRYGDVTIHVTDTEGNAVGGATIQLTDVGEFETNADGQAIIEELPAAATYSYKVINAPEGYTLPDDQDTTSFTIEADETTTSTVQINRTVTTGALTIRLVDEVNQPIVGAHLVVAATDYTTDTQGEVTIENLDAATYKIEVTETPKPYEGEKSKEVTITANQAVEEVIQLSNPPQYSEVALKVIDQDNQPVSGAELIFNEITYSTNAEGIALIQEVQAPNTYSYILGQLPQGYSGQGEGTVEVVMDKQAEATIQVRREKAPASLAISVVDQDDQAVRNAVIRLADGREQATDEAGQAIFSDLTPGELTYAIKELPNNYRHNLAEQTIDLNEGDNQSIHLKVERIVQAGAAKIVAKDQDDKPVAGIVIAMADQQFTTNQDGVIEVKDLQPQAYPYEVLELPEGYTVVTAEELVVKEGTTTDLVLEVERKVSPATTTITVVDQNENAVVGAKLQFGGLTAVTNEKGQVSFSDLEPGKYYYKVTELPESYRNAPEEKLVELTEAQAFEDRLSVEYVPQVGTVQFRVRAGETVIAGVVISMNGQEVTTNDQGNALFESVKKGSYDYELTSLPEPFIIDSKKGTVAVKAEETTTVEIEAKKRDTHSESSSASSSEPQPESSEVSSQSETSTTSSNATSVVVDETSSLTPEQSASIDEEAAKATRQFVDNSTGIEVWVNPQDATNIVRLQVEKLTSSPLLAQEDADIYKLSLLDKNNNLVELTRIAEVKVPTRPVTSQLRVVRLNESSLSNLTFALHNQRVTFRTQQLGSFAVVYNSRQASISQEESKFVSVSSSVERANLPKTGEHEGSVMLLVLGSAILLIGMGVLRTSRKRID